MTFAILSVAPLILAAASYQDYVVASPGPSSAPLCATVDIIQHEEKALDDELVLSATRRQGTGYEALDSLSRDAIGAFQRAVPFRGTEKTIIVPSGIARKYKTRRERAMNYFRPCRNTEMHGSGRHR